MKTDRQVKVYFDGREMNYGELGRLTGIRPYVLQYRVERWGVTPERAVELGKETSARQSVARAAAAVVARDVAGLRALYRQHLDGLPAGWDTDTPAERTRP